MQTTSQLLMIQPVQFGYNPQTAVNNAFQLKSEGSLQKEALDAFRNFVEILRKNHLHVTVIEDTLEPATPDSIFPNNWISFHEDNSIILYPMFAPNRQQERKQHVLDIIQQQFKVSQVHDLTHFEKAGLYLEGTGSMVLDRINQIAYACLSPRTSKEVLEAFEKITGYQVQIFNAEDEKGQPIYHTNVLMCMLENEVVLCLDAITNPIERVCITDMFTKTGKEIIPISQEQMNHFAGNMLQVQNELGEKLLIMSTQAYDSLHPSQLESLQKNNRLIHAPLSVIESAGGGSARCMIAEVFNSPK